jgi:transposase-like protein
MKKKTYQTTRINFTEEEKHLIIRDYLSSGLTKREIWIKHTGTTDHGLLLKWMRDFGYTIPNNNKSSNIVSNLYPMPRKQSKLDKPTTSEEETFETLQLKKRIAELEKQLKEAELKAIAFSTMVDLAEKEFKIPIRKKFNTKP